MEEKFELKVGIVGIEFNGKYYESAELDNLVGEKVTVVSTEDPDKIQVFRRGSFVCTAYWVNPRRPWCKKLTRRDCPHGRPWELPVTSV